MSRTTLPTSVPKILHYIPFLLRIMIHTSIGIKRANPSYQRLTEIISWIYYNYICSFSFCHCQRQNKKEFINLLHPISLIRVLYVSFSIPWSQGFRQGPFLFPTTHFIFVTNIWLDIFMPTKWQIWQNIPLDWLWRLTNTLLPPKDIFHWFNMQPFS